MKLKKIIFALMACCLSLGVLIAPISASDTPDITPPSSDKPYYAIFKRYSGTYSNYYSTIVYSDVPLDFGVTITDSRTGRLKFYSKDNSTFHIYQAYYSGNTLGAVQDLGLYSSGSSLPFDPSTSNGFIFTGANYDIYVNGDLVFQAPQDPTEGVVLGEWWIAVLNQITPNAPVILMAIGGILLLILFQILLKKSRKSSRP